MARALTTAGVAQPVHGSRIGDLEPMTRAPSLATGLVSLLDGSTRPLFPQKPPFVAATVSDERGVPFHYPYEVGFDLDQVPADFFTRPVGAGLETWVELMPPLAPGLGLGEGGTPLLPAPRAAAWAGVDDLLVKDESRNPTWSHKDRLSRCTVSAALATGANVAVIATSGNHGASAAAYCARAGLRCVVLSDAGLSRAHGDQMLAYGAAVLAVPTAARWPLLEQLSRLDGWYLVGNTATTHTGHPFGPEGYKTIAYELFAQLGQKAPAAIAVPTSYGELAFGVGKGFEELRAAGRIDKVPILICAEPAGVDPIRMAWSTGSLSAEVAGAASVARGIGSVRNGYRGLLALKRSNGVAQAVEDMAVLDAQAALARDGFWSEPASAAGLAALRKWRVETGEPEDTIVHISTSSGLKKAEMAGEGVPQCLTGEWKDVAALLVARYGIRC